MGCEECEERTGYQNHEACYGTVEARCRTGAFVTLDNGESAFAPRFANLWPGTKVLCTVVRQAREGKRKLVCVDSVLYDSFFGYF